MRAVLFDLYGVFLPLMTDASSDRVAAAIGADPAEFGRHFRTTKRHEYDAGLIDSREYWQNIAREMGIDFDWEFARDTDLSSWRGQVDPMIEFARELRGGGVVVGLLSNLPSDFAERNRRMYPWIWEIFDPAVLSCEVGMAKPDPAVFALALERMNDVAAGLGGSAAGLAGTAARLGGSAAGLAGTAARLGGAHASICPSDVLFIDDTLASGQGALDIGMAFHHFGGVRPGTRDSDIEEAVAAARAAVAEHLGGSSD